MTFINYQEGGIKLKANLICLIRQKKMKTSLRVCRTINITCPALGINWITTKMCAYVRVCVSIIIFIHIAPIQTKVISQTRMYLLQHEGVPNNKKHKTQDINAHKPDEAALPMVLTTPTEH